MTERIVILDAETLNPGDLRWNAFHDLGDVIIHDRTPTSLVVERSTDAVAVITNKVPLCANAMQQLPQLRYIGVTATGFNIVDVDAATAHSVTVSNVPVYGTDSVAQHTIALLLELARGIRAHDAAVKRGEWTRGDNFCLPCGPIVELRGRTLGIAGLGRIGLAVARIGQAMGMRILAASRSAEGQKIVDGVEVEYVPIDDLFQQSDVVSLHCPLTSATAGLVNADQLERMKPSAFLINTSRGQLIDQPALAAALRTNQIAAAALDVLETEPPAEDNPLLSAPRCLITPHVAWYAEEARARLLAMSAANLKAFFDGTPQNVVNST
ncbi:MAG: D-2-hydroxyacid dehydrogenase [Fuerstiella sp.]|nr:D-2-hydroxyacid dehydrogenase [Fuerstiella sp.]MDG2126545.1 D-2-hydroxyacid dehydrogenase [Fuerstiella sp.]